MKTIINGVKYDTDKALDIIKLIFGISVHTYYADGAGYFFKMVEKGDFRDIIALSIDDIKEEFEHFASVEDYESLMNYVNLALMPV